MNKKSLLIAVLLIFVVILSSSSVFAEEITENVDLQQDDNTADIIQANESSTPKTETIISGSSSSTIQDKINSLSDGDTLDFEAGEYTNISIYVDKSITLNGNGAVLKGYDTPSTSNTPNKVKTTINEGGYGQTNFATIFLLNTKHITLNGFTFIGGANSGSVLPSALVYAYNVTDLDIHNNTFDGSCSGLYMNTCPDGSVYNNTVKNQASTGILNFGSARTIIKENTVINAANHGIDARHPSGANVQIINNTVINSKEGIYLMHSKGHIATNNTIINCTLSSITCYGSGNIRIYNNKLQYSRIGVLLANGYSNITIENNDYQLYRLPMPPIFTYFVAEAKSDYNSAEDLMGTYTDISENGPFYSTNSEIPTPTDKVINYDTLLKPTGETKTVANGASSSEIQAIIDTLNDGDAIAFAENGVYYNVSIYTTKNIKFIGNNATLYGLEQANMADMPTAVKNAGSIYLAVLYSINNTNVSISNLNIISRYPNHGLLLGTTPTNEYKTAAIYGLKSENIVITNCKIDGASFGIMLHFIAGQGGCANAIVTNNYISNQYTYGILNFGSKNSYIANNTIVNAKWHGIDVRHQMGPNVIVYNNTIIGSYEGIYLMHSHGHKVYTNIIKDSKVSSITAYGSVPNIKVNNIYIFNNTLEGSRIGILLGGGNQNVTIGENIYKLDNQKSGDKPGFGIYIAFSENDYSAVEDVPGNYNDQNDIILTANDLTVESGKGIYSIKVTDSEGKTLANRTGYIILNNEKVEIKTDANGIASINLNLNEGAYDVETFIVSDYYYSSAYKLAKITVNKINTAPVNKINTIIIASGKSVYLQAIAKGSKYTITLKDAKGNVLKGKQIIINFNGKKYTAKTNSYGIATVTLKATSTLSKKATIKYSGDNIYNGATKTVTIKVSKEASKITATKKTFKVKAKTKKYTISLKTKSGKAISKAKVTIKVKGKTYTAKTNAKGKVTFNLKKLTKKGTYKATISFAGNTYFTKSSAKIKITVKK